LRAVLAVKQTLKHLAWRTLKQSLKQEAEIVLKVS